MEDLSAPTRLRRPSPPICLATSNKDKRAELKRALFPLRGAVFIEPDGDAPVEDGRSYEDNARIKAEAYSRRRPDVIVVAEDSGLHVEACPDLLGLDTGPFLRRMGDQAGLDHLLGEMTDATTREARFVASVAVAVSGECLGTFTAQVAGRVAPERRGSGGFGFDPIFVPAGTCLTLAQMAPDEKAKYSPRTAAAGKALPLIHGLHADEAVLNISREMATRVALLDRVEAARITILEQIDAQVLLKALHYRRKNARGVTLAVLEIHSWHEIASEAKAMAPVPRDGEPARATPEASAIAFLVLAEQAGHAARIRVEEDFPGVRAARILLPNADSRQAHSDERERELKRLRHGIRNLLSSNWTQHKRVGFFEPLHSYGEGLSTKSAKIAFLLAIIDMAVAVLETGHEQAPATALQILALDDRPARRPRWTELTEALREWTAWSEASTGLLYRVARDYRDAFAAVDACGLEMASPRGAFVWWGPFKKESFDTDWPDTVKRHISRVNELIEALATPGLTLKQMDMRLAELKAELVCLDTYIRRLREAVIVY